MWDMHSNGQIIGGSVDQWCVRQTNGYYRHVQGGAQNQIFNFFVEISFDADPSKIE